jgi:hypothetical protein
MSLESILAAHAEALAANTSALRELLARLPAAAPPAPAVEYAVTAEAPPARAAQRKPRAEKTAEVGVSNPEGGVSNPQPPPYEEVRSRVLALAGAIGGPQVRAWMNDNLGVLKAQDLAPAQYAGAIERLDAALKEHAGG